MSAATLTPARRRALAVLLDAALSTPPTLVRVSNQTSPATVYWQTADWLLKSGLAEYDGWEYLTLTDAGRDIAKAAAS